MSWRDEPVTKGELYDALVTSADRIKEITDTVAESYKGMARELVRYAAHVQGGLFREVAKNLKGDNE